MLETPKALSTFKTRKKFKDVTMDNQQETKIIKKLWVGSSETIRLTFMMI